MNSVKKELAVAKAAAYRDKVVDLLRAMSNVSKLTDAHITYTGVKRIAKNA